MHLSLCDTKRNIERTTGNRKNLNLYTKGTVAAVFGLPPFPYLSININLNKFIAVFLILLRLLLQPRKEQANGKDKDILRANGGNGASGRQILRPH